MQVNALTQVGHAQTSVALNPTLTGHYDSESATQTNMVYFARIILLAMGTRSQSVCEVV